jgi:hypothetical protein
MPPEFLGQLGQNFQGGLGQFLGGLFGGSDKPYKDAMDQFQKYFKQAQGFQNPFWMAGVGALPQMQQYLAGMKDPSGFINKQMGKYKESPYAKYEQEQGLRAAQNMGSASGLTGSTPLTQFAQQQAQDISSQDMNTWLQNVLGVNTQYGQGLQGLIGGGQQAANSISDLLSKLGQLMGQGAYGAGAGKQQDTSNLIGGLVKMFF